MSNTYKNLANAEEPWLKWDESEIYEVDLDGITYLMARHCGQLYVGVKGVVNQLHRGAWRQPQGNYLFTFRTACGQDQSCAYLRWYPNFTRGSKKHVSMFRLLLSYLPIPKAAVCYLTKLDGPITLILPELVEAGWVHVATNKSVHKGGYNVYLFVHPGYKSKPVRLLHKKSILLNAKNDPTPLESM